MTTGTEPTLSTETCDKCGGSGRLTIYDTATYVGQECYPIGDEPCPRCCPDDDDDPTPWCSGGHMSEAACTCGEIDSHD